MKKLSHKSCEEIANRKNRWGIHYNNFPPPQTSLIGMYVYQSGHKKHCSPGYISDHGIYDHYIIHYIVEGKGFLYKDGKTFALTKGDLFLISAYEKVIYQADVKQPWQYYWVGFNGPETIHILNRCGFSRNCPIIHSCYENHLQEIFHKLAYHQENNNGFEYILLAYLYQIFPILIHENTPQVISTYNQYYVLATEYIQRNYANSSLTVKEITEYLNIDRSYLYRIFEKISQKSIQEYILNFRLQKASILLAYTSQSIKSISHQCGFANQSYFSIAFKTFAKMTAKEYRKQFRQQVD